MALMMNANATFRVGGTYMARRGYNSKTITWEPCVLVEETETHFKIKYLEDGCQISTMKVHKRLAKRGKTHVWVEEPGLRLVTSAWIAAEQKKVDALKDEASRKQFMIDQLIGR